MSDDKKLSLIDQSKEIMNIIQELEASGDEVGYDEALQEKLVSMLDKQSAKVDAYGYAYKKISVSIDQIDLEIAAMTEHLVSLKKKQESKLKSLERAALFVLELQGIKKIEGFNGHKISRRESEKVVVYNQNLLPEKFIRLETKESPDKKSIKESLNNGEEVPGAKIEVCSYVKIE